MSTATKVLIVFCEGPHDVAFVSKVLRQSVIVDQAKMLSPTHFKSDANVQAFAAFVSQFAQFDEAQALTLPDAGQNI